MHRLRNRLISIAAALLLIVLGGTVGFVVIEHYSWFDAFYMTLITVSTVGYAELHPLSFAGRIFNSFRIFFGVTIMLLAVGGMTQFIIALELNQYFEKRRPKKRNNRVAAASLVSG